VNTFKQKTILITGASGGIGAAMARQLADPSVTLLLTARSEEALRTVAADAEAHGTQTAVFPRDLSRPGAAEALHDAVTDAGFAPDVLVGNAGFGALGRFESESAQTYAEMLTLNVVNLTTLTRRCLPHMLDADAGNGEAGLLNVASTAAHQPLPYFAVYAASKSYVLHFSQALWAEYRGRGLTVTCLSPGPTRTGFQTRAGSMSSLTGSLESAEKVARTGLRALLNGRHAVVSGAGNKAGALLGRLSPRRAVLAIMERAFKAVI
jgi:short-subunit dehydrogenase